MSREITTKTMACLTCKDIKAWPDAFPSPQSNQHCWRCWWLDHLNAKHPRITRKARKLARRRALRIAENDIMRGAFGDDKTLLMLADGQIPTPSIRDAS